MNDEVESILDEFDFGRVERIMAHLNWTWATTAGDVPTIGAMRRLARSLLTSVVETLSPENPEFYVASGGFYAEGKLFPGNMKKYLSLKFVVAEWRNYE